MNDVGRVGSMGKPVGEVEFRVVDDNDAQLPPGEVLGELVFRHPRGQLSHYHNLPDATADSYRGRLAPLGRSREDRHRRLLLFLRPQESFLSADAAKTSRLGRFETVVNGHPAVLESAAYAVPSELGEDEVKIAAVLKPARNFARTILIEFCRDRMAYYAVPRYIEYVDELPKTGTQRIQYAALKARGVAGAWDREQAGIKVERSKAYASLSPRQ